MALPWYKMLFPKRDIERWKAQREVPSEVAEAVAVFDFRIRSKWGIGFFDSVLKNREAYQARENLRQIMNKRMDFTTLCTEWGLLKDNITKNRFSFKKLIAKLPLVRCFVEVSKSNKFCCRSAYECWNNLIKFVLSPVRIIYQLVLFITVFFSGVCELFQPYVKDEKESRFFPKFLKGFWFFCMEPILLVLKYILLPISDLPYRFIYQPIEFFILSLEQAWEQRGRTEVILTDKDLEALEEKVNEKLQEERIIVKAYALAWIKVLLIEDTVKDEQVKNKVEEWVEHMENSNKKEGIEEGLNEDLKNEEGILPKLQNLLQPLDSSNAWVKKIAKLETISKEKISEERVREILAPLLQEKRSESISAGQASMSMSSQIQGVLVPIAEPEALASKEETASLTRERQDSFIKRHDYRRVGLTLFTVPTKKYLEEIQPYLETRPVSKVAG